MDSYAPTDWTKHPLHVAAMSGNRAEVERLISQGSDVNENLRVEGTPLHIAVCHCLPSWAYEKEGHGGVFRVLLENGANVHAKRACSGTPLHDAAAHGDPRIAELLLAHGSDINSKQEDHCRTPLHRAVDECKHYMVEFLISKGADVNAVADHRVSLLSARIYPDWGMTPLHVAARDGKWEIAKLLLDAGAIMDIRIVGAEHGASQRYQGLTAWDLALDYINSLDNRARNSRQCFTLLEDATSPHNHRSLSLL